MYPLSQEVRCQQDRRRDRFCRVLDKPFIASWGPHFGKSGLSWEDPDRARSSSASAISAASSARTGRSAIAAKGTEITLEKLTGIMIDLQAMGCYNINLVTPTHQMPMILRSLMIARGKGLELPIVYNCGGYDHSTSYGSSTGHRHLHARFQVFRSPGCPQALEGERLPQAARPPSGRCTARWAIWSWMSTV